MSEVIDNIVNADDLESITSSRCRQCRTVLSDASKALHLEKFCPLRDVMCPICFDLVQARLFVGHVQERHNPCRCWTATFASDRLTVPGCLGYTPWSEGFALVQDLTVKKAATFEAELGITIYASDECSERNSATARVTFEAQIKGLDCEASASCVVSFKPWMPFTVSFPVRPASDAWRATQGPIRFSLKISVD